jgi:hypothetical protein
MREDIRQCVKCNKKEIKEIEQSLKILIKKTERNDNDNTI